MLTQSEHLFIKLAEEADEVGQRVMKLLQFGPNEVQSGHDRTNVERLRDEVNDLLTVVYMLEERKLLPSNGENEIWRHVRGKEAKISKYLTLSVKLGLVEPSTAAAPPAEG